MKNLIVLVALVYSWLLQVSYTTASITENLERSGLTEKVATSRLPASSTELDTNSHLTRLYQNEENCSELDVKTLLSLIKKKVGITLGCIARVKDIRTMTIEDYKILRTAPGLFSYYNGSLPTPVLRAMSGENVSTFGSKLGQSICQELALEFIGDGIKEATVQCLHGYYSSGQNKLDISRVGAKTLVAWIKAHPTDILKIRPEYLHAIPFPCWSIVLNHPECLTDSFLEILVSKYVNLPLTLDIKEQSGKNAEKVRSILNEKPTQRRLAGLLNSYCPPTTTALILKQEELLGEEFFTTLKKVGAISMMFHDLNSNPTHYRSSIQNHRLTFVGKVTLEHVKWMSTEVCVIFLDFLGQFESPKEIPLACRNAYIDEVIATKYIPSNCVKYFPFTWFEYRSEELFGILVDLKLMGKVNVETIKGSLWYQKIHRDAYVKSMDSAFIPLSPKGTLTVDSLSEGINKNTIFKLGPDAYYHYDDDLSRKSLQQMIEEQLRNFGLMTGGSSLMYQPLKLSELGMTLAGLSLRCILGYFSKPAEEIGDAFKYIPGGILAEWLRTSPESYKNMAMADRSRIPQPVWRELLTSPRDRNVIKTLAMEDYENLLDLPSLEIDEELLLFLLRDAPKLGHPLMVVAKSLPVNLYDILKKAGTISINVCHQQIDGMHLFGSLDNVGNAEEIFRNLPAEFCENLTQGQYLTYSMIRAYISDECRNALSFKNDPELQYLAPELFDNPEAALKDLREGRKHYPNEAQLAKLAQNIEWTECPSTDPSCNADGLLVQQGYLNVPSNYLDHERGSFKLSVKKYTVKGQEPRVHTIYLAGGPGGHGKSLLFLAKEISTTTKGDVASYLVDHRGLGESGRFTESSRNWEEEFKNLKGIIDNQKFHIRDLTPENAALDIALLGMSIKQKHEGCKLVIFGFSSGAWWATAVLKMASELFDSIVIGGVVPIKPVDGRRIFNGIFRHCESDLNCQRKMGPLIREEFFEMVEKLADPNTNACVRLVHERIGISRMEVATRLRSISQFLKPLFMDTACREKKHYYLQLILPFVKASVQCTNGDTIKFEEQVWNALVRALENHKSTAPSNSGTTNNFVNQIISSQIFKKSQSQKSIHFDSFKPSIYNRAIGRQCLSRRHVRDLQSITSDRTAVYIIQGLLDMSTGFDNAEDLYESLKVPYKAFQPFNHQTHRISPIYMKKYLLAGIYGHSPEDLPNLVKQDSITYAVRWDFPKDVSSIWDYVKDEEASDGKPLSLPEYKQEQTRPLERLEFLEDSK